MKVLRCSLMSTLIVFLILFFESETLKCEDCAFRKNNLPVEQLKQLRYESLKNQLLKKLHLREAPKINLPKPSLGSLLKIAEMAQNDTTLESEKQPKTEWLVIYPTNENRTCSVLESYSCNRFEFSIPESLFLETISFTEVCIYKMNSTILQAYQIVEDHAQNTTNMYKLSSTIIQKGTQSLVKYSVLNVKYKNLLIEILDTKRLSENAFNILSPISDEVPFLIVGIEAKKNLRMKRSSCAASSPSCCKENFYLSFDEIGWDNWILHPDGYQANFCRGRCLNDVSQTHFYHSAVLLSFITDNKDIAEEIGLSMCCTPSIMEPITIFYRNEEGLIYQKTIENMRVEACDCA